MPLDTHGRASVILNTAGDITITGVDGSGAAQRVAIWQDADTLTSDADLLFDGTKLIVGTGGEGLNFEAAPSIALISVPETYSLGLGFQLGTSPLVIQKNGENLDEIIIETAALKWDGSTLDIGTDLPEGLHVTVSPSIAIFEVDAGYELGFLIGGAQVLYFDGVDAFLGAGAKLRCEREPDRHKYALLADMDGEADVSTVDATPTTIVAIDTSVLGGAGRTIAIEGWVVGQLADGSAAGAYKFIAAARINDAGPTAALVGAASITPLEDAGFAASTVTIDTNAATVRIRATGIAATNINWRVNYTVRSLGL